MSSNANDRQVAGTHYKGGDYQHWDFVAELGLNYFVGQFTKYLSRWRSKNGTEDLLKAQHYLEKFIEIAHEDGTRLSMKYGGRELMGSAGSSTVARDAVLAKFCDRYSLDSLERLMVALVCTTTHIDSLRAVNTALSDRIAQMTGAES